MLYDKEKQKAYYKKNKTRIKKTCLAYYNTHKEEIKKYRAKWHQENKFTKRVREIKKAYGISYEAYEILYKEQKMCCAICWTKLKDGFDRDKCIDHDHNTGKVRGLLCSKCNFLIGLANDDPEILLQAIKYITK